MGPAYRLPAGRQGRQVCDCGPPASLCEALRTGNLDLPAGRQVATAKLRNLASLVTEEASDNQRSNRNNDKKAAESAAF